MRQTSVGTTLSSGKFCSQSMEIGFWGGGMGVVGSQEREKRLELGFSIGCR